MEIKKIEQESNQLVVKAQGLVIKTNEDNVTALEFGKVIKRMQKEVDEAFDPIIDKAHQAHKEAVSQKKRYYEPLVNAERLIKQKSIDFQMAQERIRQEQERKLQEEAEKKRQEALAKAEAARAEGKDNKADKYEEKAANIVAPTLASNVQEVKGSSLKDDYDFEVINPDLIPRDYLVIDEVKIRRVIKATKGSLAIPGVKVIIKKVMSLSGGK